ncbi:Bacteriohemerythrin [Fundidesulfovibrio magnetotacticus]|uniref:Bacteriohemerythrin n=1 Tax=Fundidesulfovibrio magnetotacticus TaxID=2730080 RepID=A0A6V8LS85_9BACT|nr:hemerythrin family protein [Fundidesulfovibrio magnetotacticus]GFK93431.1 Bacteriohemerythrin [Fundidesulfovibrio magnetotacticus]
MTIYWFEDLATGIPDVDAQHQDLIAMINELDEAIATRQGISRLSQLTDGLILYARHHFATEERLMAESGYRYMAEHLKEHEQFGERVMAIAFESDAPENHPRAVSEFLHKWLIEHIGTVDKLMGECLAG